MKTETFWSDLLLIFLSHMEFPCFVNAIFAVSKDLSKEEENLKESSSLKSFLFCSFIYWFRYSSISYFSSYYIRKVWLYFNIGMRMQNVMNILHFELMKWKFTRWCCFLLMIGTFGTILFLSTIFYSLLFLQFFSFFVAV